MRVLSLVVVQLRYSSLLPYVLALVPTFPCSLPTTSVIPFLVRVGLASMHHDFDSYEPSRPTSHEVNLQLSLKLTSDLLFLLYDVVVADHSEIMRRGFFRKFQVEHMQHGQ